MHDEAYFGIYKSCTVSSPKRYIFVQKFLPYLEKLLCKKNQISYLLGSVINTICKAKIYFNIIGKIWVKENLSKNIYLVVNCCFFWIENTNSTMCLLYVDNKWDIWSIKMSLTSHKVVLSSIYAACEYFIDIFHTVEKSQNFHTKKAKNRFFGF